MPYDNRSLNSFVNKQGGSLANLGASPTYTGAPAASGTPPGGMNPNMQAYGNAPQQAAFQPGQPAPGGYIPPQPSLQRLGMPNNMQSGQMPPGRMQAPGMRPGQLPAQGQSPIGSQQRTAQAQQAMRQFKMQKMMEARKRAMHGRQPGRAPRLQTLGR